jgi:hypothetical protein
MQNEKVTLKEVQALRKLFEDFPQKKRRHSKSWLAKKPLVVSKTESF